MRPTTVGFTALTAGGYALLIFGGPMAACIALGIFASNLVWDVATRLEKS